MSLKDKIENMLFGKMQEAEKIDGELVADWITKWPPGKVFEYLGIKLTVVKNRSITPYGTFLVVTANYIDKNGVIRSNEFMKAEMDGIDS